MSFPAWTIAFVVFALLYLYVISSSSSSSSRFINGRISINGRIVRECEMFFNKKIVALRSLQSTTSYDSRILPYLVHTLQSYSEIMTASAWNEKRNVRDFVDTLAEASRRTKAGLLPLHRIGVYVSSRDSSYQDLIRFSSVHGHFLHPFIHGFSWGLFINNVVSNSANSSSSYFEKIKQDQCVLNQNFQDTLLEISKTMILEKDESSSTMLISSHGIGHAASMLAFRGTPKNTPISGAAQCMYSICKTIISVTKAESSNSMKKANLFGCMHGASRIHSYSVSPSFSSHKTYQTLLPQARTWC